MPTIPTITRQEFLVSDNAILDSLLAADDRVATGAVVTILIIGVTVVFLAISTVIGLAIYRNRAKPDDDPPFRIHAPEED